VSGLLSTRTARRRALTYAALVVLSLLLMAFSRTPLALETQRGIGFVLRPFQGALDTVAREIISVADAVREIDRLRLENRALRDDNERLTNENRTATELRRENELLTGLLQVRSGLDYTTVGALVIARESSEFQRVVTLDKGTDSGIAVGNVVIADGGALAGRVIEAGSNFARVQLLTDTASTVIGQLSSTAATGEVIGQLQGVLIMSKVDAAVRIQLGEEVVTAGLELKAGVRSPYPKGLVIGQVIDFTRDANEVVQSAFLQPAANVERLEFVLVIVDYQGGLPSPEGPAVCAPTASGTLPDTEQPCVTVPPVAPTPRPSAGRTPAPSAR
jgi:rod shape-determining protein MreC